MSKSNAASRPTVIVGAGIGGLSVGCYLAMNGYETLVPEMDLSTGIYYN